MTCQCQRLDDTTVIDMTDQTPVFQTLREIKERGKPWWWLHLYVCQECAQGWLVAAEEAQNDIYCLRRLTKEKVARIVEQNEWPSDFDHYDVLLEIGLAAGHSVQFFDVNNATLLRTIKLLATQRPGIRVTELARLLNLTVPAAEQIARRAVNTAGVTIKFV